MAPFGWMASREVNQEVETVKQKRRLMPARMAVLTTLLAMTGSSVTLAAIDSTVPASGNSVPALPAGGADVSDTAKGRRLMEEAAARNPVLKAAGQLRAVKDDLGYTVAPAETTFISYSIELPDGTMGMELAPLTEFEPPTRAKAEDETGSVLAAAGWSRIAEKCFARISDGWAWMDHCYHMYKESNDGSSSYDYYALKRFATMGRNDPWRLWNGRIRATRSGGASQTWVDWSPGSDWSGGSCSTITVSMTSPIAGVSMAVERCPETWDMYKSANGTQPDYHLTWSGNSTGEREVAFVITVRVAQGGTPSWGVPAYVHGGLA